MNKDKHIRNELIENTFYHENPVEGKDEEEENHGNHWVSSV